MDSRFSAAKMNEMRNAFSLFDRDGDGTISAKARIASLISETANVVVIGVGFCDEDHGHGSLGGPVGGDQNDNLCCIISIFYFLENDQGRGH